MPSDDYNRQEATSFFAGFPQDTVENIINETKHEHLLSDNKNADRRTPGRTLTLSRK